MALQPKRASRDGSVDTGLVPPRGFITTAMHLAMMTTAEWDRELIANLSAQRRGLCKPEMMRIGGTPAANQAWLFGDCFHMLSVADPPDHRQPQDRFIDTCCPISASAASSQRFGLLRDCRLVCHKGREL